MHAISYQMKRGHLSAVAVGRSILRGSKPPEDPDYDGVPDMTPARFDILYLVLGRKSASLAAPRMIQMATLRRALGLARSTISEAVKRLVELELVTCTVDERDRRRKTISLTEKGEARIKRALHLVLTGRVLSLHYQAYVGTETDRGKRKRPWQIGEELRSLHDEIKGIALHLFDTSTPIYAIRGRPNTPGRSSTEAVGGDWEPVRCAA